MNIDNIFIKVCPDCGCGMNWDASIEKWRCPECGAIYTWEYLNFNLETGVVKVIEHKWHEMGLSDDKKLQSLYTPLNPIVTYEINK